jgi:hypothetical protein
MNTDKERILHLRESELIYLIANALQEYDEKINDCSEGNYTSFADRFISKEIKKRRNKRIK